MARDAFAPRIVDELTDLCREIGGGSLVLSVAPAQAEIVATRIPEDSGLSISVLPDEGLVEGQAFLRIAERERMVDFEHAIDQITQRVSAFLQPDNEVKKHG